MVAQVARKQKSSDARTAEKLLLGINATNVDLRDLTKMGSIIVTINIMPESPEDSLLPFRFRQVLPLQYVPQVQKIL